MFAKRQFFLLLSVLAHVFVLGLLSRTGWGSTRADHESRPVQIVSVMSGATSDLIANKLLETTEIVSAPVARIETAEHANATVLYAEQELEASATTFLSAKPYYFSTKELTQSPIVEVDVPDDFSLPLFGTAPQIAVLRILINKSGTIDQVLVENSELPELIQNMVTEAFSKTRFHPGEINGIPVNSEMKIEVLLESDVDK